MAVSRCKRVPYTVYLRAIYTTYYLMVARDERNRSRKPEYNNTGNTQRARSTTPLARHLRTLVCAPNQLIYWNKLHAYCLHRACPMRTQSRSQTIPALTRATLLNSHARCTATTRPRTRPLDRVLTHVPSPPRLYPSHSPALAPLFPRPLTLLPTFVYYRWPVFPLGPIRQSAIGAQSLSIHAPSRAVVVPTFNQNGIRDSPGRGEGRRAPRKEGKGLVREAEKMGDQKQEVGERRKTSSHLKRASGASMASSTVNGGGIGTRPKTDVAGQVHGVVNWNLESRGSCFDFKTSSARRCSRNRTRLL